MCVERLIEKAYDGHIDLKIDRINWSLISSLQVNSSFSSVVTVLKKRKWDPVVVSYPIYIIIKRVSWFKSSLLLRIQSDSFTNINS
jgi:hypothetical protein